MQLDQGFRITDFALPVDRLALAIDEWVSAQSREIPQPRRGALREPAVVAALESAGLVALARKVVGDLARPVRAILFDKPRGTAWSVPWHQDLVVAVEERAETAGFRNWSTKGGVPHAEAPATVLEQMVALRCHLDDVGTEDGPLLVLPGTHREGRLTRARIQAQATAIPPTPCIGARGTVVLMRPLLVHASRSGTSGRRRRVLHVEFAGADLPDGLRWSPL